MGLFSSTVDTKTELIRLLLTERIRNDPAARAQGFTSFNVRQMPAIQVTGTIEAGIVYMVEMIEELILKGHSEEEAIVLTERHRSSLGRGILPTPLNTSSFIHYRVDVEYKGAPIPDGHVDFCIKTANHFFTFKDDKGSAANSIKFVKLEETTQKLEWIYALLVKLADAEITEDEFYETVSEDVYFWADEFKERKKKADTFKFKASLRELG